MSIIEFWHLDLRTQKWETVALHKSSIHIKRFEIAEKEVARLDSTLLSIAGSVVVLPMLVSRDAQRKP